MRIFSSPGTGAVGVRGAPILDLDARLYVVLVPGLRCEIEGSVCLVQTEFSSGPRSRWGIWEGGVSHGT